MWSLRQLLCRPGNGLPLLRRPLRDCSLGVPDVSDRASLGRGSARLLCGSPRGRRATEAQPPMTLPYVCLNCDEEVTLGTAPDKPYKLYCSEGCSQEAELVRYARRRTKDGRIHEPDVAEAIRIRLAHVMAGGYPKQARRIPPKIRAAVTARDNGQCRACGGSGTEIDHINGSSQALENLQLLCDPCHNKKNHAKHGRRSSRRRRLRRTSNPEPFILGAGRVPTTNAYLR